jgi:hypothetical protein
MSVKLNCPPKPEESQKDPNFNGKTIPYPGFEPGTSGLAVGSHNLCTIWVGQNPNETNRSKNSELSDKLNMNRSCEEVSLNHRPELFDQS